MPLADMEMAAVLWQVSAPPDKELTTWSVPATWLIEVT